MYRTQIIRFLDMKITQMNFKLQAFFQKLCNISLGLKTKDVMECEFHSKCFSKFVVLCRFCMSYYSCIGKVA